MRRIGNATLLVCCCAAMLALNGCEAPPGVGTATDVQLDGAMHPHEAALRAYIDARNAGDYAGAEALLAPDARIWFNEKVGPGARKTHDTGWGAWDQTMNARNTIKELKIDDEAVVTIMHEENDFSRLIGFGGWRSRSTFWFDRQGRIIEQLYEPLPVHPTQRECFATPLAWLRENKPVELAAVYPNEQIEPGVAMANAWRNLLIEWRLAVGLDVPDEVAARYAENALRNRQPAPR